MKRMQKILLSLLISVLLGSAVVEAAPSRVQQNDATIHPADQNEAQSTHPLDQPNLFNIYHSAESSGNLLSNVPVPYLTGDERDDSAVSRMREAVIEKWASAWLQLYEIVDRRPVVLKLIFPYHTFL